MSDAGLVFLVEHLPRIGATSVLLEGACRPKFSLGAGQNLEMKDEAGRLISIPLPTEIVTDGPLRIAEKGRNSYTVRLKSRPQDLAAYKTASKARNIIMSLPEGKWCKKELAECGFFRVRCLGCQFDIIDERNCNKLNELPSEFWQELMDYWHCHKPHQPSQEIWYSARYNSLQPAVGEIVIGGSFFLAQPDTFAGRTKVANGIVQCARCCATIGDQTKDKLYKIRKWHVFLSTNEREKDLFPPEQDVVFTLLNLLKGYSTRYVLLSSKESQLVVWIFAVGLDVTLSNNKVLKNCIKILFRQEIPEEEMKKHNIEKVEVESLPMQSFMQSLQYLNGLLPYSAKSFGEWRVGYATFAK
ncbi:hypothetical protein HG536_0C06390 [Torulaspora globosa]|uniref:HECT-type E3 ubiquitin transferase E3D n=1 Tax=Torulaspora globosa TaxID=48254 RepID=A0A7G3ZG34_9SACH|nr:uncharacterized protein HG536_0C06390 [Torulaspora globosa]QLL32470.1 hypothetical protein HG536_0C06390 [Torulaspora globosa]